MKVLFGTLVLLSANAFAAEYIIPNVSLNTSDFKIVEDEHSPNPVKYSQDGECKLEKSENSDSGYVAIYITDKNGFFESLHFKQDREDLQFMALDYLKPNMCDFHVKELKSGNFNLNNKCKEGLNSENLDIEFDQDGIIKAITLKKTRFGAGHSIPLPSLSSSKIKCKF